MAQAFAYLRVSGKGQLDGDGFDRQLDTIRRYAERSGVELAGIFREEGVSGTNDLADRPALTELFGAVHSSDCRIVLVERLDRFSRALVVQEALIAEFESIGLTLIACDTGIDVIRDAAGDPMRVAIRQILGAIAQLDKSMTVKKLKAARDRKRAAGERCEGRKPFGCRPGETEVLAALRLLAAGGLSMAAVAAEANRLSLPSRTGRPWAPGTVWQILRR